MLLRTATLAAIATLTVACQPQPGADPNVAALMDRQAIDQLLAGDYPHALDSQNWDAYADLFTADGELSLDGQSAKGRQGIKDFVGALPTDRRIIHVISNLSYTVEGAAATGSAYWQDIGMAGSNVGVLAAGHYEDMLSKQNGTWKIAKRAIVIEFVPTAAAAPPAATP
jgi:SnoaL-like domain